MGPTHSDQKSIDKIEAVQRPAARFVHNRFHTTPESCTLCWNNSTGHLSNSAGKQHESPCCTIYQIKNNKINRDWCCHSMSSNLKVKSEPLPWKQHKSPCCNTNKATWCYQQWLGAVIQPETVKAKLDFRATTTTTMTQTSTVTLIPCRTEYRQHAFLPRIIRLECPTQGSSGGQHSQHLCGKGLPLPQ